MSDSIDVATLARSQECSNGHVVEDVGRFCPHCGVEITRPNSARPDTGSVVAAKEASAPSQTGAGGSLLTSLSRGHLIAAGAVVVALVAGLSFAIGSSGEESFHDRVNRLGAEARNVSGAYLPPSAESLTAFLRVEEEVNVPDASQVSIDQYDSMPEVPSSDLFGNPTDMNAGHWYRVEFCDGGGLESWDVNPFSENAYQDTLTLGVGC